MTELAPLPRRRVLDIRTKRTVDISDAFRLNQDEWLETMSMLSDVTLIDSDFDMAEACDSYKPDFIFYESPFFFSVDLVIRNAKAHPEIPRIAFQMQDPYCSIRVHFLRKMEELGIKYMFTHMAELSLRQSPELASCTYSVSLLFDDGLYRDYGMKKDIPVSVFGGFLIPEIYNWRAETARAITDHFPTFIYTHPGYHNPVPRHKFPVYGEDYARMLNRSHFSLADTTHFDCLVRKHLEIPASGAVLVAPDAPVLKPYGFRDMENCILGEGIDLFEKMALVANDPALYDRICKSGHDLVHTRYSRKNWRGIFEFYECLRALKPGEVVRQHGIMGPFFAAPAGAPNQPAIVVDMPDSSVSKLFKIWMRSITNEKGQGEAAEDPEAPPGWLNYMVEPFVMMGVRLLLKGDLATALKFFQTPQTFRANQSGYTEYDPEEIAWLSLAASLAGDAKLLATTRELSGSMRHLSLRRMKWLGAALAAGGDMSRPPADVLARAADDQLSIHWTGQLEIGAWVSLIARIMTANGHPGLVKT